MGSNLKSSSYFSENLFAVLIFDPTTNYPWTLNKNDDMPLLKDLLGVDRLLFGSDFPHAEGLSEPLNFVDELEGFTDDEVRKVMRDNACRLVGAD